MFGKSNQRNVVIEKHNNETETRMYLESWSKRIADAEAVAAKRYEEQVEFQRATMNSIDDNENDTDMATSASNLSVDPFRPFLYPVQKGLGVVCRYIRHVKFVIIWQDSAMAFWTTIGCLILSLLCVFVPWFFLIKWTARCLVWPFPLMKLLDVFVVRRMKPLTAEELEAKRKLFMEKLEKRTTVAAAEARLKRENQAKLKAMKTVMFGKYIVEVPILKSDRYRDLPTRSSHAKPYQPQRMTMAEVAMRDAGYHRKRIQGQHLVGDMIPTVEAPRFTEAPKGKPISRPSMVDQSSRKDFNRMTNDSTAAAYGRLGSLVVVAAIITSYAVPLLTTAMDKAVSSVQ